MATLQDFVNHSENAFPFVINPTCNLLNMTDGKRETEIMLSELLRIPYALVRILPVASETKAMSQHGGEWFLIHNGFVGEKILIPLQYPGLLKVIRHPHKRHRYGSVSHLIDNPSRYVKVEEDVERDATGRCKIRAQSIIEIEALTATSHGDIKCLDFIHANGRQGQLCLNERMPINFTGLPDTNVYTVQTLIDTNILPRVIEFQEVPRDDIVEFDVEKADGLQTLVDGPIEVLGIRMIDMIVGWMPQKCEHIFNMVLIPKSNWDKVTGHHKRFKSAHEKSAYIAKTFGKCNNLIVKDKLYYVTTRSVWGEEKNHQIVRLSNLTITRKSCLLCKEKKKKDEPVLPRSNSPKPDLPERVPTRIAANSSNTNKCTANKTGPGFSEIHGKLENVFKKPSNQNASTNNHSQNEHGTKEHSACESTASTKDIASPNMKTGNITMQTTHPKETELECTQCQITEDHQYDYPFLVGSNMFTAKGVTELLRENQTIEDFRQYTVMQVCQCFHICALQKMANICYKENIDGRFLVDYDTNLLKDEPFCLSQFHIIKVKKIMNGWRSKEKI